MCKFEDFVLGHSNFSYLAKVQFYLDSPTLLTSGGSLQGMFGESTFLDLPYTRKGPPFLKFK